MVLGPARVYDVGRPRPLLFFLARLGAGFRRTAERALLGGPAVAVLSRGIASRALLAGNSGEKEFCCELHGLEPRRHAN